MVLAKDFIKAGTTLVMEYTGAVTSMKEIIVNNKEHLVSYGMGDKTMLVNDEKIGTVARYINHYNYRNCVIVPWVVKGYY